MGIAEILTVRRARIHQLPLLLRQNQRLAAVLGTKILLFAVEDIFIMADPNDLSRREVGQHPLCFAASPDAVFHIDVGKRRVIQLCL